MLMESELKRLLAERESDYLDFKRQFPESNVDLIHDILCMANANSENDRYLIYGVGDDGAIVGIENDKNIKTQADTHDCLRQSHFNRIPGITLQEIQIDGHKVAVLTIKNKRDKPYFLTKDKRVGKKTIRAGVVYSRLRDTNIPLTESSTESKIEHMWRERFDLDLSPAKRLKSYLNDPTNWKKIGGLDDYHYAPFPEFQLIASREAAKPFKEEWTDKFPDKKAFSLEVEARYHSTVLEIYTLIECDGCRYHLPLPEVYDVPEVYDIIDDNRRKWRVNRDSNIYRISRLFTQYGNLDETIRRVGIELLDEY